MAEYTECKYKNEIEELKRDSARNSEQHREFYKKFNESNIKIALSEERYNNLLTLMSEIKTTLTEIKDKPAKRWDLVISCIITGLVGGIIGIGVSHLFIM